jgi:hypothetical protein
MSLAPIHSLPQRFTPIRHVEVRHAPVERVVRAADLLGAPPATSVGYRTTAAAALSGPDAATIDDGPAVPLYAPGAHIDVRA